jgi:hydroxymethylglutaryl-CoA reductase
MSEHHSSKTGGMSERGLSGQISSFYKLPFASRVDHLRQFAELTAEESSVLATSGALSQTLIDTFIENGVGTFALPMGVATNFLINGTEYLIPMAVEESSVIAAASYGAKLIRTGGGFITSSSDPVMTGQIQLYVKFTSDMERVLESHKPHLIAYGNSLIPRLVERGGGIKDISWRYIAEINSLIVHVDIDTRDAMGANIINTVCENLAPRLAGLIPCDIGLKILTNLCDKRVARARCLIPAQALNHAGLSGAEVAEGIVKAYLFARHDIYRATTHNKGVMNGIDPLIIATGNDWRAVEAGVHAFAARSGRYLPLTQWSLTGGGDLVGEIEIPLALGTVGGVTKLHPTAEVALKILGYPNARKLAEIACAVGLAQNLAALKALATDGIQQGHMRLHQKNLDLLKHQAEKSAD